MTTYTSITPFSYLNLTLTIRDKNIFTMIGNALKVLEVEHEKTSNSFGEFLGEYYVSSSCMAVASLLKNMNAVHLIQTQLNEECQFIEHYIDFSEIDEDDVYDAYGRLMDTQDALTHIAIFMGQEGIIPLSLKEFVVSNALHG